MDLYTCDLSGEILVHSDGGNYNIRSIDREIPGHKYIMKVKLPNGKYRYFYKRSEIDAYYARQRQREKDAAIGRSRPDYALPDEYFTSKKDSKGTSTGPSKRTSSSRSDSFIKEESLSDKKEYKSDQEAKKAELEEAKENLKEVKKTNPEKQIRQMGAPVGVPTASSLASKKEYEERLDAAEKAVEKAEQEYNASKKKKKTVSIDADFLNNAAKLFYRH